ncbi:MAG: hypothetical protein ABSB69_10025 [Solirubrobacteraceae bacterium]
MAVRGTRTRSAVGLALSVAALAGCGSTTKTVTAPSPKPVASVVKPSAKRPVVPATRTCSAGVTVNAHASCPFAESILAAYATATNEEHGVVYLGVESPVTHKNYSVACSNGGEQVIACHATDAEVTLTFDAVSKARASHPAPTTASSQPSGLYGGQSRAENEEAGCKYGFTVSGETPHCNTQEEGRRIQESFRREREDPQREAENEAITEEDRSREECDERVGVAACP